MFNARKAVFVILYVFLFVSFVHNAIDLKKSTDAYQTSKENYDQAKADNARLKAMKARESDPAQIERTIRNKLSLTRPDEEVYIVPLPSPTPTPFITPPAPVYQQWLDLFF